MEDHGMILTTVIVDDEPPICDEMEYLLSSHPDVKVVDPLRTAARRPRIHRRRASPRLVFLDISLARMSGLEMASRLSVLRDPPFVVIITAHPEYALAAFETPAVGYVPSQSPPPNWPPVLTRSAAWRRARRSPPQEPAGKICVLSEGRIVFPLNKEDIGPRPRPREGGLASSPNRTNTPRPSPCRK
jgi:CheY-like chemotaxis protein